VFDFATEREELDVPLSTFLKLTPIANSDHRGFETPCCFVALILTEFQNPVRIKCFYMEWRFDSVDSQLQSP